MRKQEVSELATLKEIEKNYDKIRVDDILSYRSHAEQKHISVSEIDSMERILKEEKATQSMFIADTERPNNSEENKVYAYDLIAEALAYKKNDVLDWLKDEYSDRQLMITVPFDEYVGRGFVLDKKKGLIKEYETKDAILNGADEIDMVINLGDVKDKHFDKIKGEIALLKSACGDKILKVIIETCLLTEEEKIKMCEIVTEAGADFIKTSTGFSTSGATFDDIALFKKYVGENVKIKASGGISSFDDAKKFIELG